MFNYFELRGAAAKLTEGWTLDKIRDYTIENGCDPTGEEYRESVQALQAFFGMTLEIAADGTYQMK